VSRDDGSAVVEFVVVVVGLMVPLVYALLAVAQLQRAAFAMVQAAQSAGRAYVTSSSVAAAGQRARVALDLALGDQGVAPAGVHMTVSCSAQPCLTPAGTVQVTVQDRVLLPFIPAVFGGPVAMTVTGVQTEEVDPFGPRP
jgi:hypothetical protein